MSAFFITRDFNDPRSNLGIECLESYISKELESLCWCATLTHTSEDVVCVRIHHKVSEVWLDFCDEQLDLLLAASGQVLLDDSASMLAPNVGHDGAANLLEAVEIFFESKFVIESKR
jgi:hypothetical protein